MKTSICLYMFLLSSTIMYCQNLKGRIIYEATLNSELYLERLKKDTLNSTFSKDFKKGWSQKAVPQNFHLLFDGNESIYESEHDLLTRKRLGILMNKTGHVGRDTYRYYTNLETKEKFYQSTNTQHVLVDMDEIDWDLTRESRMIGKYKCYKAMATISSKQTNKMNFLSPVEAWYTPEISVPFGIQTFVGLPGLTLELTAELEYGKIYYYATKIELNTEEKIIIDKPKAKKKVSEKEYVELIEQLNESRKSRRQ